LAEPVTRVLKETTNKKKAPGGTFSEITSFGEHHSRVFRKLGFDLIQVNDDGSATVHAKPEQLELLINSSEVLLDAGSREKARWILIDEFGLIPERLRVDEAWISTLVPKKPADTVIELQPLLLRSEIETLIRAVADLLRRNQGERLSVTGTDFSGRQWFRGRLAPETITAISREFYSVQSLHSPLTSSVSVQRGNPRVENAVTESPVTDAMSGSMPCVAVLDTGVPSDHKQLSKYRRGRYIDQDSFGSPVGGHGSFVASRIVFGNVECRNGAPRELIPSCMYYDALVATNSTEIEDKSIVRAMGSIVATAPDVRVFNISFDSRRPLASLPEVERRERLTLLQDLDNFIFANDVIVAISAGNSPVGIVPSTPYPGHLDEPDWQLGHWAQSFNALTCGASIGSLAAGGLVTKLGWPSPFTRLGPGIAQSPKPDFNAPGGNSTLSYKDSPGLGVYGCTEDGVWEDKSGTSFAVPLLAREAAFTLDALQNICTHGTRAFSATAKAFLALSATASYDETPPKELEERALGKGIASGRRLGHASLETAVFVWQGILEGPDDIAQIHLPIPKAWVGAAELPMLKVVLAWSSPVNAALREVWASRKVEIKLRPGSGAKAIHPTRSLIPKSYPLNSRLYPLKRHETKYDMWVLEVSYTEIGEYFSAITFTPQQRVAFAAELLDEGPRRVSPQSYIQSMPIATTMDRLSIQPAVIQPAIRIKTRY
jgi:hypothetical protein